MFCAYAHLNSVNNKLNFLRTHLESTSLSLSRSCSLSFPPANEVWGKVICLQACLCPQGGVHGPGRGVCSGAGAWSQGGAWSGGCLVPGGACSRGVPPSEGVCSRRGVGRCLLQGGVCGDPLRKQTATVTDGTHSTGMQSCLLFEFLIAKATFCVCHLSV